MDVRTTKLVFKALAITGVPVTAYLAARGGKTKAERILNGEENTVILNAKSYGPAAAVGAATIASIFALDYFGGKELAAAGALTAAAVANKDRIKAQFEKYREVVKEEDGEKRDVDIFTKASQVRFDDDGETVHLYRLDWVKDPIYFESTSKKVAEGLSRINKELVDYSTGWGVVTVSDALNFFGHPELRTPDTDKAGWDIELLHVDYDCYYIDWHEILAGESPWYKDENPNVHVIVTPVDPEIDLQWAIDQAQKDGVI